MTFIAVIIVRKIWQSLKYPFCRHGRKPEASVNAAGFPTAIYIPDAPTAWYSRTAGRAPPGDGPRVISRSPRKGQPCPARSCAWIVTTWRVRRSFKDRPGFYSGCRVPIPVAIRHHDG